MQVYQRVQESLPLISTREAAAANHDILWYFNHVNPQQLVVEQYFDMVAEWIDDLKMDVLAGSVTVDAARDVVDGLFSDLSASADGLRHLDRVPLLASV
jgi:hypothetical protein